MNNKSIFNLEQNVAAALSYVLGPISGLFFYAGELITKNNNKYVRFHALQSIVFSTILLIIRLGFSIIRRVPLIGFFGYMGMNLLSVVWFLAVIFLIFMAFTGKNYRIPIIGDTCFDQVNKD